MVNDGNNRFLTDSVIASMRFNRAGLSLYALQVCGWSMVGLGVWLHINQDSFFYTSLLKGNPATGIGPVIVFENIPFILMGVGGFLSAMSFLGCCGACAESICFLGFVSVPWLHVRLKLYAF